MKDDNVKTYGKMPCKYKINKITRVTSFISPKSTTPVQIILMDKSTDNLSMNECVAKNFDLDFCKIIFDGQNVIRYDNGTADNKQCTFSMSKNNLNETQLYATWHRIKKYTARGYDVIVTK